MNKPSQQLWTPSATGNQFQPSSGMISIPLPVGIYRLQESKTGPFLERVSDKFEMPEKVYGLNRNFINRVKKTILNSKDNLGVLVNGIRGTGKTVTCELLCNELYMPIVIVERAWPGLGDFLITVQMEMVIFFDEFEKIFKGEESQSLLPLMDGVLTTEWRRIFLMTTNELRVDHNMLQRPGRIRYIKTFGNLSPSSIEEIVEDKLESKNRKDSVIRFISELEIITVDIVVEVCQEVNIHDEDPEAFRDCFNVRRGSRFSSVYEVHEDGTETVVVEREKIRSTEFTEDWVGENFYTRNKNHGTIVEVIDSETIVVQGENDEGEDEGPKKTYRVEPVYTKNPTYRNKRRGNEEPCRNQDDEL